MKKVPFQKWRIFWFGLRMVVRASRLKDTNPELALAYSGLAELSQAALVAIREGRQEQFLRTLDLLDQMLPGNSLDEMLNGTSQDIPEWLRKPRK